MKEILQQYATYNVWANQKLIDCMQSLSEEMLKKEVASSFNSLHGTVLHMLNAESIWWHRLKEQKIVDNPTVDVKGSFKEVASSLLKSNKLWEDWVNDASEEILNHHLDYTTTKGEPFKQPVFEVVLHVFNHGTYHRGQLVNILRQLGIQKIPQTDFIVWGRGK